MSGVFLNRYVIFLRQGPSLRLKFSASVRLTGQEASGILRDPPVSILTGILDYVPDFVIWMLGLCTQDLLLTNQAVC